MADKGLIAASANLAKSRIPADTAGDFLKTFTAATDEMQKEQQAIQGEVAGYLGSLKTDIDFTSLSPEMEKQTRSYLATERSEYNDLANTVARVKDPSSKKYQDAVDRMNEIKRNFTTLASEIASYNQEKINTATDIDRSVYSKGVDPKDLAIQKNIYGLSENGMASMSIQNGHLNFNVDGSMVRYDKIKPLPMPSEVPMKIIENGATFSGYNRALTSEELKEQSAYLDNAIKDPSTLASVLFDHPSDLPLTVIAGEFATARKDGTLQEKMPDFIMRTKEAIINGYETSALEGKGRYDAQVAARVTAKTPDTITPPPPTAAMQGFSAGVSTIKSTAGRSWVGVDAKGDIPIGKDGRVDTSKIVGYKRGKTDNEYGGWSFEDGVYVKKGDRTAFAAAN